MPKTKIQNMFCAVCIFVLISIVPAYAIDHIRGYVPAAEKVGQGRMTYMFWDIYDAALFAPQGAWNSNKPFALELSYLRNFEGKKIADRSVEEIRKQGFKDEIKLAIWHSQMRSIFPDVGEGDRLTGVYIGSGETVFYLDNTEIGRINDSEFSVAFFGIWLDETTSAPDLRLKLLGAV